MKTWLLVNIFIVFLLPFPTTCGGFNNPFAGPQSSASVHQAPPLSTCFCPLAKGELEDCPCSSHQIEVFNNRSVQPQLMPLLESHFFRYFQVDFSRPCRHWPQGEGACASPLCAIEVCSEDQVQDATLKINKDEEGNASFKHILFEKVKHLVEDWVEPYYIYILDLFGYSFETQCEEKYSEHEDVNRDLPEGLEVEQFCPLDTEGEESNCQFVDLVNNEEKYTGYSGRASNKVWEKIYNELCFQPEGENQLNSETVKSMCLEKRAFYRVVSGLHASISIHICSRYLLEEEKPLFGKPAVWGKNYPEFSRRFSPSTTSSEGPERLKNVYFLYLLELRALVKAAPLLNKLHLHSGMDSNTLNTLSNLLKEAEEFPHQFNEEVLFQDEARELLSSYKEKISEIKEIMDCLGCERCKVWGKVQVTGLGTALKILFSPPQSLSLTKHEVVALVNAFGRVSSSLEEIAHFREAS